MPQGVANLTKEALQLGQNFGMTESKSYQRVGTNLIKEAEVEQNIARGDKMKLATGMSFG